MDPQTQPISVHDSSSPQHSFSLKEDSKISSQSLERFRARLSCSKHNLPILLICTHEDCPYELQICVACLKSKQVIQHMGQHNQIVSVEEFYSLYIQSFNRTEPPEFQQARKRKQELKTTIQQQRTETRLKLKESYRNIVADFTSKLKDYHINQNQQIQKYKKILESLQKSSKTEFRNQTGLNFSEVVHTLNQAKDSQAQDQALRDILNCLRQSQRPPLPKSVKQLIEQQKLLAKHQIHLLTEHSLKRKQQIRKRLNELIAQNENKIHQRIQQMKPFLNQFKMMRIVISDNQSCKVPAQYILPSTEVVVDFTSKALEITDDVFFIYRQSAAGYKYILNKCYLKMRSLPFSWDLPKCISIKWQLSNAQINLKTFKNWKEGIDCILADGSPQQKDFLVRIKKIQLKMGCANFTGIKNILNQLCFLRGFSQLQVLVLGLAKCNLGDNIEYFTKSFGNFLHLEMLSLDLSQNRIKDDGLKFVSDVVLRNPKIQDFRLLLATNSLAQKAHVHLASMIQGLPKLKLLQLNVSQNPEIGDTLGDMVTVLNFINFNKGCLKEITLDVSCIPLKHKTLCMLLEEVLDIVSVEKYWLRAVRCISDPGEFESILKGYEAEQGGRLECKVKV